MSAVIDIAQIGHNSASYMKMIEDDPAIIYRDNEALPALVTEINALIVKASGDIATKKGREAIASLAHSISRRKTPILEAGKRMTESWRKKTGEVNARKSAVETQLDSLRDKARAPLDAWEAAEKERSSRVDAALNLLREMVTVPPDAVLEYFDEQIRIVEGMTFGDDFGDQLDAAEDAKVRAITALKSGRAAYMRAEADRAELARLRAAEVERLNAEREAEARRQAEAAKQALIERIAAEAEARVKAEQEAATERVRIDQEAALAAERRKAQEAQDALAAEQQKQAKEKADRERAAVEQAEADATRQADLAHRSKIMGEAKTALMTFGIDEAKAKQIVLAISAGTIPHTHMRF